jgi:hypothetical protein
MAHRMRKFHNLRAQLSPAFCKPGIGAYSGYETDCKERNELPKMARMERTTKEQRVTSACSLKAFFTSLIAVTSACAVGSVCFRTMLWQLTTTSSLWTTTAPNGPPSPHSTPRYASSTAFVKNLWSLSCTAAKFSNHKFVLLK